MLRDALTATIVSLTLFATAPLHEGDSLGVQLLAATGDVRRTLVRFLDLYADLKAGAQKSRAAPEIPAGAMATVARA